MRIWREAVEMLEIGSLVGSLEFRVWGRFEFRPVSFFFFSMLG